MKLIIGNLKMNLNYNEIEKYIDFFKEKNYSNVFFAPTSIYLQNFVDNGLNTVSQDVSSFENGSYTGDVSSYQLKSIGINYSLVGHSERRKYYNDNLFVNKKIIRLLEQEIIPILCIGESKEERDSGKYLEVIKDEIDNAFANIKKDCLKDIILAYEPIWSIGTGLVPENSQIEEVASYIKKYVKEQFEFDIKVLYGGSVNNNCIEELEKIENIDGYLVGGCSLKCEEFEKLINFIS